MFNIACYFLGVKKNYGMCYTVLVKNPKFNDNNNVIHKTEWKHRKRTKKFDEHVAK